MRIAINALFLLPNGVGGSETYLRGLVAGLERVNGADEYLLILGPEAASTFPRLSKRWRIVTSPVPSASRALRLTVEQLWLPRLLRDLKADVVHSTGYTAPLVAGVPAVVSIHDMNYRRHPEDLSLAERLVYALLIPRGARRSARIMTLSQSARADVVRFCRVSSRKVAVVPGAPREDWPASSDHDGALLAAAGVTGPFVLSVAAAYPHKNLSRLIEAFPLQQSSAKEVQLVLVGLKGRAAGAAHDRVSTRQHIVKQLGWVDDRLLAALYRSALALAFPSLYEGFGLPILEAMSVGTAVLTSNYGAMAEVAGQAAELVDPRDIGQIQRGLERIATNTCYRTALRERGLDRARAFSWDRTAQLAYSIYRQLCG